MIKLIACDLDETLLDKDKNISEENKMAITKAKAKGIKFVCATGRGYPSVDSILKQLDLYDEANQYVISTNGSIITENKNHRVISMNTIRFELVEALFAFAMKHKKCIQIFTQTDVYGYLLDDDERKLLFMFKPDAIEMHENTIEFLKNKDIVKVMYHDTLEELFKLAPLMTHITDGQLDVSYSSNRYMEFTPYGIDKGKGLLDLAQYLGIKQSETMAIGDNYNDLSMILKAGVGVSVANAYEDIKKHSDYICENDHNHSAVAEVINKFILERD